MAIKAVIFGASGMIGRAILLECLEDGRVEKVLTINRRLLEIEHPKLEVLVLNDFENLGELSGQIKGYNACFYAIGIPSTGLSEEQYKHVTHDLTIRVAEMLVEQNPGLTFCFVSATGADSSENGRSTWARIKGMTENALQTFPFKAVYCFRPGYVWPMKGVRSQVKTYRLFYLIAKPLNFIIRQFHGFACTSVEFGRAMINAVHYGSDLVIHESRDIVKLGRKEN